MLGSKSQLEKLTGSTTFVRGEIHGPGDFCDPWDSRSQNIPWTGGFAADLESAVKPVMSHGPGGLFSPWTGGLPNPMDRGVSRLT